LVKSVTRQVVADRPSHMAEWPPGLTSTDFWLRIPGYCLLKSVIMKPTRERLQSGAGRLGGLASRAPPGPTSQWPLHTTSSCLVQFQGGTSFGGIPNFLVIS
jgi:hypothetical protein